MKRVQIKEKPVVIITNELQKQIDFLHKKEGTKEWSGLLFYQRVGDFSDINSLKFICKYIHLYDIGTHSFTSYTMDDTLIDVYDRFPEFMSEDHKYGQIHTHHNMNAFFSGTDEGHLEVLSEEHNYILSLIVNFDGKYCAKVATRTTVITKSKVNKSIFSKDVEEEEIEEEVLVVLDCNIQSEIENSLEKCFSDRYESIKKSKTVVNHYHNYSYHNYGNYNKTVGFPVNTKNTQQELFNEGFTKLSDNTLIIAPSEQDVRRMIIDWLNYNLQSKNEKPTLTDIISEISSIPSEANYYYIIDSLDEIFQKVYSDHFIDEEATFNKVKELTKTILDRFTGYGNFDATARELLAIVDELKYTKSLKNSEDLVASGLDINQKKDFKRSLKLTFSKKNKKKNG